MTKLLSKVYNKAMILSIPRGFTIFGFELRFYGIIIAIAMGIGVFLACKNAKYRNLKSDDILILALYVLPLAVIGARMFSFFSELHLYSSFWQIFNLRTGGLSIFGGIIGGAIAIVIYCLIHKKNFFAVADVVAPSLILGQAIGRWGNFFNQEVYGFEVTNPSLQWFPFSVYIESTGTWHLANFFYEFVLNSIIFVVLILMLRKFKLKQKGIILASYLIMYGTIRSCLETLRMPEYILYLGSVRISLLTSILCVACGVAYFIYLFVIWMKKKKNNEFIQNAETSLPINEKTVEEVKENQYKNTEINKKSKTKRKETNKTD